VENVQVTVAEDIGVEHRGAYYQEAGALRDMVQNHLTQLVTVVAMEVPVSFEAGAIQAEKLKVLHSISPIPLSEVVFGQYQAWQIAEQRIPGYREEKGLDDRNVCRLANGNPQLALARCPLLPSNRKAAAPQDHASRRHVSTGAHSGLSLSGAGQFGSQ
jgi:hypothetical protein